MTVLAYNGVSTMNAGTMVFNVGSMGRDQLFQGVSPMKCIANVRSIPKLKIEEVIKSVFEIQYLIITN